MYADDTMKIDYEDFVLQNFVLVKCKLLITNNNQNWQINMRFASKYLLHKSYLIQSDANDVQTLHFVTVIFSACVDQYPGRGERV